MICLFINLAMNNRKAKFAQTMKNKNMKMSCKIRKIKLYIIPNIKPYNINLHQYIVQTERRETRQTAV